MNRIFMMSILGGVCLHVSTSLIAGGDDNESAIQSPGRRSLLLRLLHRSSSHSSSSPSLTSQPSNTSLVGSPSSSGSSNSLSIASPRRSRRFALLRRSHRSVHASITSPQSQIPVQGVTEENLKTLLKEAHQNLDQELEAARTIVIPGVIQAAYTIFERSGYSSNVITDKDNDGIADIRNTLNHMQQVLQVYVMRTSNLVEEYQKTVELNFERAHDFCPKGAYMYLGCTMQEGMAKSCDDIKTLIDRRMKKATMESTKWILRQIGHTLGNSESKQLFDAYLKGEDALTALQLDPKDRDHYWYLVKTVGECNSNIEDLHHTYKKKLEVYQDYLKSHQDLSHQALELDIESNIQ